MIGGAAAWRHRQRYRATRDAYENAVRQVQATDQYPAAVVRCAELERDFMRAWWLPWSFGLGLGIRKTVMVCAGLTLLAFALKGPVQRAEMREGAARSGVSAPTRPRVASTPARPTERQE